MQVTGDISYLFINTTKRCIGFLLLIQFISTNTCACLYDFSMIVKLMRNEFFTINLRLLLLLHHALV